MPSACCTRRTHRSPRCRRDRSGSARAALVLVIGVCALLFGGGALAWRWIAHRPAESATARLIPADADMVLTLDLKPSSPEQVAVFQRIDSALKREGLDTRLDDLWDRASREGVFGGAVGRDLKRELTGGFALVAPDLAGGAASRAGVVLLASVRDAGRVSGQLKQASVGSVEMSGTDVWELPGRGGSSFAAVSNGSLLVAERAEMLRPILAVARGERPAIASVAAYREARAALPPDANLVMFVSADGVREAYKQGQVPPSASSVRPDGWFAAAATVRGDGVAFDWCGPWDASGAPEAMKRLAAIRPLDGSAFEALPSGAVAVAALSEPAGYGEFARDLIRREVGEDDFERAVRDLERESGLSLDGEILPGLRGNALVALYPDDNRKSADALLVVDDARGADPARLADALRRFAERVDRNLRFDREERDGVTAWTAYRADEADAGERELPASGNADVHIDQNGIDVQTQDGRVTVGPDGIRLHSEQGGALRLDERGVSWRPSPGLLTAPRHGGANTGMEVVESFAKGKDVVYATVGKTVIAASSARLLDRAIAARRADGGVAGLLTADRSFDGMYRALPPGSQWAVMVSPARLRDALLPAMKREDRPGDPLTADELFRLLGADSDRGLIASARYDGKLVSGSLFLPLDFDQAVTLIGRSAPK